MPRESISLKRHICPHLQCRPSGKFTSRRLFKRDLASKSISLSSMVLFLVCVLTLACRLISSSSTVKMCYPAWDMRSFFTYCRVAAKLSCLEVNPVPTEPNFASIWSALVPAGSFSLSVCVVSLHSHGLVSLGCFTGWAVWLSHLSHCVTLQS